MSQSDLRVHRNRITAQISRDKKIIETKFIREEIIQLKQQVREMQMYIEMMEICPDCSDVLRSIFNLAKKKVNKSME